MNRREAFAAALGAVCAAMLPRPSGGLEADVARIFGVERAATKPGNAMLHWVMLDEEAAWRRFAEHMAGKMALAMQEKLDREWLEKPA
jgi:nicotinic acid phosphoribosyltransferase